MANWRGRIGRYCRLFFLFGLASGIGPLCQLRAVMAQTGPAGSTTLTPQLIHFFNQVGPRINRFLLPPPISLQNVRIVNSTSTVLCAMIFVFGQTENLIEGCGCPMSQDTDVSISVSDLRFTQTQGELLIFSAEPNASFAISPYTNGFCDPTVSLTPQTGLTAWLEYATTASTESADGFTPVAFDSGVLNTVQQSLSADVVNGVADARCSCGDDSTSGQ
jgi:hypothetical protein